MLLPTISHFLSIYRDVKLYSRKAMTNASFRDIYDFDTMKHLYLRVPNPYKDVATLFVLICLLDNYISINMEYHDEAMHCLFGELLHGDDREAWNRFIESGSSRYDKGIRSIFHRYVTEADVKELYEHLCSPPPIEGSCYEYLMAFEMMRKNIRWIVYRSNSRFMNINVALIQPKIVSYFPGSLKDDLNQFNEFPYIMGKDGNLVRDFGRNAEYNMLMHYVGVLEVLEERKLNPRPLNALCVCSLRVTGLDLGSGNGIKQDMYLLPEQKQAVVMKKMIMFEEENVDAFYDADEYVRTFWRQDHRVPGKLCCIDGCRSYYDDRTRTHSLQLLSKTISRQWGLLDKRMLV